MEEFGLQLHQMHNLFGLFRGGLRVAGSRQ
jgi:hypothetical protein